MNNKIVDYKAGFIEEVIVNHSKHGLIYTRQASDDCYTAPNFKDFGIAVSVMSGDTIDGLSEIWSNQLSIKQIMIAGYDIDRPVLELTSTEVEDIAVSALEHAGVYSV